MNNKHKIKPVRQKMRADCAICCIAMATGKSWYDVFMTAPITEDTITYGLTLQEVINTIRKLGYKPKWHDPERRSPNKMGTILRERVRGKNAIHLVPSINVNEEGCLHYVLVHDGKIYDPSPKGKLRYKRYDDLLPMGIIYQPEITNIEGL